MNFGNANFLIALVIVPLLLGLFFIVFKRKRWLLQKFGNYSILQKLIKNTSIKAQYLKVGLICLAAALIVVAIARPQYGTIERPLVRKGVDIMIAIDTSLSMRAQDIKPSRLARAKEQLRDLVHRLRGDRVGIISFAGMAFVQCPLTLDYGIALDILDTIDTNSVPVRGTAIGAAIRKAIDAFKHTEKGYRVLVLLTDGEDQGSDPIAAAKEAAKEGIKIYCIGIGSTQGMPIPLEQGGYKEDKQQHKVNSRLDFTTLEKIALATGGKAIKANPHGELELDEIYGDIDKMQKKLQESRVYTIYEDRFQYVLLPAIVLLILEGIKSDRKREHKEWTGRFE
jgi:Ca-activated chloride channel family protein